MADSGPLTEAQSKVYRQALSGKRDAIVGPLRAVLHSPELCGRWQALGEFLRFDTSLPAHIAELSIICTGRYWNCQLEWLIHSAAARDAGLPENIIESIRIAQVPNFDEALQENVYEFTRELLEHGQVSDGVYQELLDAIGVASLVELTAVVGYYSMVAMTLNAHEVPLPDAKGVKGLDLPAGRHLLKSTRLPQVNRASNSGVQR